jgi:hypothetical protein
MGHTRCSQSERRIEPHPDCDLHNIVSSRTDMRSIRQGCCGMHHQTIELQRTPRRHRIPPHLLVHNQPCHTPITAPTSHRISRSFLHICVRRVGRVSCTWRRTCSGISCRSVYWMARKLGGTVVSDHGGCSGGRYLHVLRELLADVAWLPKGHRYLSELAAGFEHEDATHPRGRRWPSDHPRPGRWFAWCLS